MTVAYADIAALQMDNDFAQRTIAAYAVETLNTGGVDPASWQAMHSWDMAAQPGFGDAYASAIAGGVPRPGLDPAVITDGMILSAIQGIAPVEPEPEPEPVP
jgi:hypothetical protein